MKSINNNVKYSLLRADLASLEEEFSTSELDNNLRHQVKDLVESEMKRQKTRCYQRIAVKKVKKETNFWSK